MSSLLLRNVEVEGEVVDVRCDGEVIVEIGRLPGRTPVDEVIDGGGGALIAGLHDHHLHLLAMAAATRSVRVGPDDVAEAAGLAAALRDADGALPAGAWIRAVGYHESVAGVLDRWRLDAIAPSRPVRVQHRSGAQWILNSAACDLVGLAAVELPGIDRDDGGAITGQIVGLDAWLADRIPRAAELDLAAVGHALASVGVTGVTDATPTERIADMQLIAGAMASGALPQAVAVTGGPGLRAARPPEPLSSGPVKLVVADHALPDIGLLAAEMRSSHDAGRAVAVHCVTRVALVVALAAWHEAGARPGDRVEHGAVVSPDLAVEMAALGLTVVTQPGFVFERGDAYRRDVDEEDLPHLYPCASLLASGVAVGGSTDAPFGTADPWRAIDAAVRRKTASGAALGAGERVPAARALALFLAPLSAPGGSPRRVEVGAAADLCLLDAPLDVALREPNASRVVASIRRGSCIHRR